MTADSATTAASPAQTQQTQIPTIIDFQTLELNYHPTVVYYSQLKS
jgi:hypothetical protein